MKDDAARARAEALFRKDGEGASGARRPADAERAAEAEKTARLKALRLAKEEAERAQLKPRR